jgi:hypothetical protein
MGLCGMGLNRHIAQRPRDICYILKGKELITKFIFSPRTFAALHPYYLALINMSGTNEGYSNYSQQSCLLINLIN